MALDVKVGSFTLASGSQTINPGFQPKAIQLWTSARTANGSGSAHARFSYGHATDRGGTPSMFHWCAASEDAIGTSDVYVGSGTASVLKLTNGTTATVVTNVTFTEFVAGGFTLNCSTATELPIVNYIAYGGDDLEDALASSHTITGSPPNAQDVTVASGFGQPSLVFAALSWHGGSTPATADMGSMFGFGVKSGSQNGRCAAIGSVDASGTQASSQIINNNRLMTAIDAGALQTVLSVNADSGWPTDGYEIQYHSGANNFPFYYLALKFSSDVTVTTGESTARTTTGTTSHASSGTPKLGLFLGTMQTTANTIDASSATCAELHLGAVDGAGSERSAGLYDDDGQATSSVCGTWQSDSKAYRTVTTSTDATDSEADGTISGSDVVLDFTDAAASAWIYEWVTLGEAGAGGTTYEKAGELIADTTVSAPDVAEFVEVGKSIAGTRASAADVSERVETGASVAGTRASASDVFEAVEAGATITGTLTSALDVSEFVEAGATLTGTLLTGPSEVPLPGQEGALIAGTLTSAPDVFEAVETGAVTAATTASAADVFEAVETGSTVAGTLTAAAGSFESGETGALIAAAAAQAADVFEAADTGALVAGTRSSAADAAEVGRTGTVTAGTRTAATDTFEAAETGNLTAGTLLRGPVQAGFISKLGALITTARASAADSATINRLGALITSALTAAVDVFTASETGSLRAAAELEGASAKTSPQTYEKTGQLTAGTTHSAACASEVDRVGALIATCRHTGTASAAPAIARWIGVIGPRWPGDTDTRWPGSTDDRWELTQ